MNDDAYVIITGWVNSLLYPLDELNTHAIRGYMTQGTFVKLLVEISHRAGATFHEHRGICSDKQLARRLIFHEQRVDEHRHAVSVAR